MDFTSFAAIGAVLVSLATGIFSFIRSGQAQKVSEDVAERKVDGEQFDRITRELRLTVEDLRAQNARQQGQIDELRVEVAHCEEDKNLLKRRLVQLTRQIEGT